jgi:hypothetical protein
MSRKRDDILFELEQRLAQVGRKLSAEDASSLIAEVSLSLALQEECGPKQRSLRQCHSGRRSSERSRTSVFAS